MAQQIAVPLNNIYDSEGMRRNLIALVDYGFTPPMAIDEDGYVHPCSYSVTAEGESIKFPDKPSLLAWLEESRPHLSTPPHIIRIKFLCDKYLPAALEIQGSDLLLIQQELDKIPRRKYETAEELLFHCLPDQPF